MSAIAKMSSKIGRNTNKLKFVLKKNSPEILLGVGIAGFATSIGLAIYATTKADQVLDHHNQNLENIEKAQTISKEYTDDQLRQDLVLTYAQTFGGFARLYAPSILVAALSVGCVIKGHKILNARNAALMTAYGALEKAYNNYRERIVSEFGEEAERKARLGLSEVERTVKGEDGNEKTEKAVVADSSDPSIYARWFDEANPRWEANHDMNLMFLNSRQEMFNRKLRAQGHLFLNEVYEELGIKQTPAGQLVGWLIDGDGDGHVDFGIYDDIQSRRDFVNGWNESILLDFNVDGKIYDLI